MALPRNHSNVKEVLAAVSLGSEEVSVEHISVGWVVIAVSHGGLIILAVIRALIKVSA